MTVPRSLVCKHLIFLGGTYLKKCLVYILASWCIFLAVKDLFGGVLSGSRDNRTRRTMRLRSTDVSKAKEVESTIESHNLSEPQPNQSVRQQNALKAETTIVKLFEVLTIKSVYASNPVLLAVVLFIWKKCCKLFHHGCYGWRFSDIVFIGGAFLKKFMVYIFASWCIFLTVKDLFSRAMQSGRRGNTRQVCFTDVSKIEGVESIIEGHDDCHSKNMSKSQPHPSVRQQTTVLKRLGIFILETVSDLILHTMAPFAWKKFCSLCYQNYQEWVSSDIVQSIFVCSAFLKECLVHIFVSCCTFLTVKDLFNSVLSESKNDTSRLCSSMMKEARSLIENHDDCKGENVLKSQPNLNPRQQNTKIKMVKLFRILVLRSLCHGFNPILQVVAPFFWKKYCSLYKWISIIYNIVWSISFSGVSLKEFSVCISARLYVFLTPKDFFGTVLMKSRGYINSDVRTNVPVIKGVYKSMIASKGYNENLQKSSSNVTGVRQSVQKTKKEIILIGILIIKTTCFGCNVVFCNVNIIVTNFWKKYKMEFSGNLSTFSWQGLVTADIGCKLVGLCSEQKSNLDIHDHPERGDRPLKKQSNLTRQMHTEQFKSHNEYAFGLAANRTAVNNSNYSQNTYRSQIAIGLQHSKLTGVESVADKAANLNKALLNKKDGKLCYREDWETSTNAHKREVHAQEPEHIVSSGHGYSRPTYAVLIGQTVTVYDTSRFASLPNCSKFMVKERIKDSFGATKVKLALKSCEVKRYIQLLVHQLQSFYLLYNIYKYFFCGSTMIAIQLFSISKCTHKQIIDRKKS